MAQATSIVVAYWHNYVTTHVQQDNMEGDRWFWAWEAVDELVHRDCDQALKLVVELADACPSARALAYLGAGPVEDLVKKADDVLFERIVRAARTSRHFRCALATIWIDDQKRARELTRFFKECPPKLPDGVVDDTTGP